MNTLGLNFNLNKLNHVSFTLPKRPLGLIAVTCLATFALQKIYNSFVSHANQIKPDRVVYNAAQVGFCMTIALMIFGKGMDAGKVAARTPVVIGQVARSMHRNWHR